MATIRSRLLPRAAALLVGCVGAALVAEFGWRAIEPGPLAPATIVDADGEVVDLSFVVQFLGRQGGEERRTEPVSRLAPGMEASFRYDGPPPPWHDEHGGVTVRTNSLGFRDEEFTVEKPPGEWRVLCVGDSFTFGLGVQAQDTWVEQVEDLLRERHGAAQVVNGGFAAGAHSVADYAPWIASQGLLLDPDAVVLGLCLNDVAPIPLALAAPPVDRSGLLGSSRLLTHLRQSRADRAFDRAPIPDAAVLLDVAPERWEAARAGILAARDACAERGVPLVVFVLPVLYRLGDDYPCLELHRVIRAFCAEHGVACVDGYPAVAGRPHRSLWAHPTDQHPNPRAHRLLAQALVGPLAALLEER